MKNLIILLREFVQCVKRCYSPVNSVRLCVCVRHWIRARTKTHSRKPAFL
jgi:hypothetical protein